MSIRQYLLNLPWRHDGSAHLAGQGSLASGGGKQYDIGAALVGTSGAQVAGFADRPGSSGLSGSGNALGTGAITAVARADLSGAGALGPVFGSYVESFGSSALFAIGAAGGSGFVSVPGSVALSGVGRLWSSGFVSVPGSVALSGVGRLSLVFVAFAGDPQVSWSASTASSWATTPPETRWSIRFLTPSLSVQLPYSDWGVAAASNWRLEPAATSVVAAGAGVGVAAEGAGVGVKGGETEAGVTTGVLLMAEA